MPQHYLAVCTIFRDEAAYLAEWVAFHRAVGVERFFLYDNGSVDAPERVLAPHLADGSVTVEPWPIPFHRHAAKQAYAHALERARGHVRWLACIDVDEFLFAPQSWTLPPVLAEYEDVPGVVVRWQVYGSSGRERSGPEPVIDRFRRRAPTGWIRNRRVKSIVDPERAVEPANVHHFRYRDGALAVDERKVPVTIRARRPFKKRLRPLYRLLGPALRWFDPYAAAELSEQTISIERLRINHYPIKSREEFAHKARYKKEKKRYEGVDYFAYHDRNDVEDAILARYLPELAERTVLSGGSS